MSVQSIQFNSKLVLFILFTLFTVFGFFFFFTFLVLVLTSDCLTLRAGLDLVRWFAAELSLLLAISGLERIPWAEVHLP